MKLIVFYEPSNIYVLNNLNSTVTHFVIGSISVTSIPPLEVFLQVKAAVPDAIVLAVSSNRFLENIVMSIRAADISAPILIVRNYVMQKNLPFMSRELFLADSVELLQNVGGGI